MQWKDNECTRDEVTLHFVIWCGFSKKKKKENLQPLISLADVDYVPRGTERETHFYSSIAQYAC